MVARTWKLALSLAWLGSLAAGCHLVADISEGKPQCPVDENINGLETDVDCGGPCAPCAAGQRCEQDADCATSVCEEQQCLPASCFDGRRNGDESGVDCGGSMMGCRRCLALEACRQDDDCASFAIYRDESIPLDACFREEADDEFGFCLPSCCSADCTGCPELCELKNCCSNTNECCQGLCTLGPNAGILLYGEECGLNTNMCFPPLQCLPDQANTLRCQ